MECTQSVWIRLNNKSVYILKRNMYSMFNDSLLVVLSIICRIRTSIFYSQ